MTNVIKLKCEICSYLTYGYAEDDKIKMIIHIMKKHIISVIVEE